MENQSGNLQQDIVADELFKEITTLIHHSRKKVAVMVNSEVTLLYWQIGKCITESILKNQRAVYGEQIVATLSHQLTGAFGRGFTKSALNRMILFYKVFNDGNIVATLSQQLSWSHFIEFIAIKDSLKREFYVELCRQANWSVRILRQRMDRMLYERTALSRKPEELIRQELNVLKTAGAVTHDLVFRDPYVLDFLGLKDTFNEQDVESAIIRELQQFILELGSDFAFLARQKRIIIDNDDFRIDLLFYHRGLKRLVAIDLKMDKFKPAHIGQMELYLKWLDKYERKDGENNPIGLILCTEKRKEQIELLELNHGHIRVAEYMTGLPSKSLLEEKLQHSMFIAKQKFGIPRYHEEKQESP